jgi:hypothetical protein
VIDDDLGRSAAGGVPPFGAVRTLLLGADTVAKVDKSNDLKISRKAILDAATAAMSFRADTKTGWSFLRETMWSLTSPRAKRIGDL